MATVLEAFTTKEQCSAVCFLWTKQLNEKDIHKEMIPAYGGKRDFHQFGLLKNTLMANVSLMTKKLKQRRGSG
jgi:hypothetical protein